MWVCMLVGMCVQRTLCLVFAYMCLYTDVIGGNVCGYACVAMFVLLERGPQYLKVILWLYCYPRRFQWLCFAYIFNMSSKTNQIKSGDLCRIGRVLLTKKQRCGFGVVSSFSLSFTTLNGGCILLTLFVLTTWRGLTQPMHPSFNSVPNSFLKFKTTWILPKAQFKHLTCNYPSIPYWGDYFRGNSDVYTDHRSSRCNFSHDGAFLLLCSSLSPDIQCVHCSGFQPFSDS